MRQILIWQDLIPNAPIGVVLAWEKRESNTSVRVVFAIPSGFDAPVGVDLAWEERGSCLNIFRTKNRGRISETFTKYEFSWHGRSVDHVLTYSRQQIASSWNWRSVDHVLTYSGRQIAVGSLKPSRITRQKTCCVSESNMSVRVVFANRSDFDAPIGVVLAWVERGSCLNIFRKTNRSRISETFANYEAKDLLRKVVLMLKLQSSWHGRSVDHDLIYSGRQIAVGSQNRTRITRQKTCCASESNTSVRVVFANHSGFDAPIAVVMAWEERGSIVMAWEERGSCLDIFWMTNRGRISESFSNYEAKDLLQKSVDHVLTYSRRQIAVGSQKPLRITRQKTCCASESNTSIRVVFANRSGFDAPIGVLLEWEERGSCLNIYLITNRVVMAREERGSCLNIFRTTNNGQISETFTNYEAKDLLRKSVDHVLTYSGRQISVGSQKPSQITRQKTYCANESNTSVRVVLANRSCFDAPIGVVLTWEESRSCLNLFQTTNHGRISETFTNYEAKDLLRNVDHVLTYFGRQIAVESQKPSRSTRQKTCCASETNTSVRVVFANRSGFDAPIGVLLAWEERGSCLNIYQITKRGRISETFTNYEAKDLLRKSVNHVLTYSGRQIGVGSQKTSRITIQKTCCASESNTSVRVVFANRSGFGSLIAVDMAWEERGSCINIFRMTNRGRISEIFVNYDAKDLLRKSVVHVLTYSRRQIAVGSQKPSRITRQKTCCASESNTSIRVVFANRSGFDAPIGVLLAWEERGSCLNIYQITNRVVMAWEERGSCLNLFQTKNHGRISETFTNYEAKDLLHMLVKHSVRVVFANRSGFDAPIAVVMAWEECG
ncbi:uncharacterized protein G2W53_041734 [Senna tora]|uniref:Uncharacterized protein n=1 Tax=Senna tora TaxID=362788 RepID=A0A834VY99_9FABA|nr:uncharacterized protein G2W53_041734 [Senna tora]